jgi:hypothetical protein
MLHATAQARKPPSQETADMPYKAQLLHMLPGLHQQTNTAA